MKIISSLLLLLLLVICSPARSLICRHFYHGYHVFHWQKKKYVLTYPYHLYDYCLLSSCRVCFHNLYCERTCGCFLGSPSNTFPSSALCCDSGGLGQMPGVRDYWLVISLLHSSAVGQCRGDKGRQTVDHASTGSKAPIKMGQSPTHQNGTKSYVFLLMDPSGMLVSL